MPWLAFPHEPEPWAPNEAIARKNLLISFLHNVTVSKATLTLQNGLLWATSIINSDGTDPRRMRCPFCIRIEGRVCVCKQLAASRIGLTAFSLKVAFKMLVSRRLLVSILVSDWTISDIQLIRESEHYIYIG